MVNGYSLKDRGLWKTVWSSMTKCDVNMLIMVIRNCSPNTKLKSVAQYVKVASRLQKLFNKRVIDLDCLVSLSL